MPGCPGRRGTFFGTSSSSKGNNDNNSRFRAVLLKGLSLLGENYDYEVLKKREECEIYVRLYKECKTEQHFNCNYFLANRPEDCPNFNHEEFLQTLRSSNQKSNGKIQE